MTIYSSFFFSLFLSFAFFSRFSWQLLNVTARHLAFVIHTHIVIWRTAPFRARCLSIGKWKIASFWERCSNMWRILDIFSWIDFPFEIQITFIHNRVDASSPFFHCHFINYEMTGKKEMKYIHFAMAKKNSEFEGKSTAVWVQYVFRCAQHIQGLGFHELLVSPVKLNGFI